MARKTTHSAPADQVHIIGLDDDDQDHFLYQDRVHEPVTEETIQSTRELGVAQIVTVTRLAGYDLPVVVAGRQRVKAARLAEREIEYKIIKGDPLDLVKVMARENALRLEMTPLDKALEAKKVLSLILEDEGLDAEDAEVTPVHLDEVAETFAVTRQSVKDWFQVLAMDPKVLAAIKKGKLSFHKALTGLRKVKDPEAQKEKLGELIAAADEPKVKGKTKKGQPRKRNMNKAIAKFMANDEESSLSEPDLVLLGFAFGLSTAAECGRLIEGFKKSYDRAKRQLKKED